MKFYFIIIAIVAASVAGGLLFFMPINQETLQICANLHDEISSLIPEKDMTKIEELGNKFDSYKCNERIEQWKDLAKYNVIKPT